jgi:hypothetical protein
MKYELDKTMFGDKKCLVDRYQQPRSSNAKFNIKVRAADLKLMERLAELTGRTRPSLLNDLVENILERELQKMAEDDKDSAAVLARHVDLVCGVFDCFSGWSAKVFGRNVYGEDDEGNLIYEQDYYWGTFEEGTASPMANELIRRIRAKKQ